MQILIFDMDGVLLEANGYHRALQRTVQLSAEHLNLNNIHLKRGQIHTFESLGISSEWHSSALCLAYLEIQLLAGDSPTTLDLRPLFSAIQSHPLTLPARQRAMVALQDICREYGVEYETVQLRIEKSEDIESSLTMNWFQELVLGSENYQERYQKEARLNTGSYLAFHDRPLISLKNAQRLSSHTRSGQVRAAIMTNRPSRGPQGFGGSPEAELGRELVGLAEIPLIGYGDISWLAEQTQNDPGLLGKPHSSHALAAIFLALGLPKEISLKASLGDFSGLDQKLIEMLPGTTITVFEDTPGGIIAVEKAREELGQAGIKIVVNSIGITSNQTKRTALEAEGAKVIDEINTALSGLNDF